VPPDAQAKLAKRLDKLYEFEREPITPDKLHSGRYFAGMYAGEHVAATEFVIGALFVQWGVGARDLVLGLLIGNALAVLSWVFICAPIAVRTRLTLYWYVRRVIGLGLTVIYNIVNALLYCFLAAAMIGVSASAVIIFVNRVFGAHLAHPKRVDILPPSVPWIIIVLVVGAVVIALAIAGFKKLSQFAAVCSPWMLMIFVAGAVASLPKLGEIHSLNDFWRLAETKVWTGTPYEAPLRQMETGLDGLADGALVPDAFRDEAASPPVKDETTASLSDRAVVTTETPGQRWRITDEEKSYVLKPAEIAAESGGTKIVMMLHEVLPKLGFWHIMFFAWFCNLAMHVGLSDMAVFRFAKHWTYGFYSAFGMYLGHYLAWVCAGIMGAVIVGGLDPGKMAYAAAGMAGVFAVLVAGWTTANPTIYRAGLALQIITPNWPRWAVTLAAGGITTVVACFPFIFLRLLEFVAIYGLTLMPIGAVIFVEHWLFPRLGLQQYWSDKKRLAVNPAALIAWLVVLVFCFPIEQFTGGAVKCFMAMFGVDLFFRWLPGWFIAVAVYIVLSYVWAARVPAGQPDEAVIRLDTTAAAAATPPKQKLSPLVWAAGAIAFLCLIACLVLPVCVFAGATGMSAYMTGLFIATIVYFVAAVYYMAQREKARAASQ
jgi:purine-cytosine permease-like protein